MILINIILDKSGSMGIIAGEVVGMVNKFLSDQKEVAGEAEVSLIQFDNIYEENYIGKPIKWCEDLVNGKTYVPRGMTALYDAIGRTINTVKVSEKEFDNVLFVIITDGEENASKEFTNTMIKEMIGNKPENWDFIFLAAGIDASLEASKIGIMQSKCASFSSNARGITGMCATMSDYTTNYRMTGDTNMKVDKK